MAVHQLPRKAGLAVLIGIMVICWWGGYEAHLWEGYEEVAPEEITSEEVTPKEQLFPFRSSKLMLPQRLLDGLTNYLSGDVCQRWDTPEDGEDLVRLFLKVAFHANDQNVSQEDVTISGLGVSTAGPIKVSVHA